MKELSQTRVAETDESVPLRISLKIQGEPFKYGVDIQISGTKIEVTKKKNSLPITYPLTRDETIILDFLIQKLKKAKPDVNYSSVIKTTDSTEYKLKVNDEDETTYHPGEGTPQLWELINEVILLSQLKK